MILTKHLYRLDEIRSAFLYSLKNRSCKEAIFWLHELEESCYGSESRRLLLLAWMMFIGLKRIAWLAEWSTLSTTKEGRLQLCWQLIQCSENDSSIWWVLMNGVVNMKTGYSKLIDTWNMVCHLDDEHFWKLYKKVSKNLKHCVEALQQDMRSYTIFAKCICHCISSIKFPRSSWKALSTGEPVELQLWLTEWDSLSLRKGRVFEIPNECLLGMTWRGAGGNTMSEIYSILPTLKLSPYWKRILQTYIDTDGEWLSDESQEEFYDKYFGVIEDIPDEWSLKDQQKSHGVGIDLSKPESAILTIWWSNWICQEHMWIWGKSATMVYEWCKQQRTDTDASMIDRLSKLYKERLPREKIVDKKKDFILIP